MTKLSLFFIVSAVALGVHAQPPPFNLAMVVEEVTIERVSCIIESNRIDEMAVATRDLNLKMVKMSTCVKLAAYINLRARCGLEPKVTIAYDANESEITDFAEEKTCDEPKQRTDLPAVPDSEMVRPTHVKCGWSAMEATHQNKFRNSDTHATPNWDTMFRWYEVDSKTCSNLARQALHSYSSFIY